MLEFMLLWLLFSVILGIVLGKVLKINENCYQELKEEEQVNE